MTMVSRTRKLLFAMVVVGAIGTGYGLWPRREVLPAYHCDKLNGPSETDACMNHQFPARDSVLAYMSGATFESLQAGAGYSLRYFDRNGRYVLLSFGGEAVPWGYAFIGSGRWWLREAVLPLTSGHETRKAVVQEMCSLEYTWTDQPRDEKDEDPDIACGALWEVGSDTLQESHAPQTRRGGDFYDLSSLYHMDGYQFRIQDFSSASPGSMVTPGELARAAHLYKKVRLGSS
jgi:hypothetical protein